MGKYLDDRVVEQMIKKQHTIPLQEKEMTMMFCDIRSFTTLSERMDQRELALLIQEFRNIAVTAVKDSGGYIDKFMGDGYMATWGVPIILGNHQEGACKAILEMRKNLIEYNTTRAQQDLPRISVGFGVAAGRVLIGEVENSGKTEYSVLGNAVNVASRLQDLTKLADCDCVVSKEVFEALKNKAAFEDFVKTAVKGKFEDVHIYKILGLFNEAGVFYSNYLIWDIKFIGTLKPGLMKNTVPNLKLYDYGKFRKKRAA